MTDAERLVIGWINSSGVCHAYLSVKTAGQNLPDEYASVELTGSDASHPFVMQRCVLAVQAWSRDRSKAKALAYRLVPVLTADHGPRVAGLSISNLQFFPSEDDLPRYQMMVTFTYQN